ncbi:hypothetical protein A4A49_59130, partial [Nicotiana attenuata]
METLLVVLMLSIQSNGLKLHIDCSISTYISTPQEIASIGNKQCNVTNALAMQTTKFLSILKEGCWMKQQCKHNYTKQQECIQDSRYQSITSKAGHYIHNDMIHRKQANSCYYQMWMTEGLHLNKSTEVARGVYLQVLSMRINTSLAIQLREGKSTCTAIRFEWRRLGSTCTHSTGQSLTSCNKVETVENHLGTNQLDAAAEGYGVLLMEKMRRRRRLSFNRERVERKGRYSREWRYGNEMGEMIGIWDICGVGGQMWLLMQILNYERAIHEIGYNHKYKLGRWVLNRLGVQ